MRARIGAIAMLVAIANTVDAADRTTATFAVRSARVEAADRAAVGGVYAVDARLRREEAASGPSSGPYSVKKARVAAKSTASACSTSDAVFGDGFESP